MILHLASITVNLATMSNVHSNKMTFNQIN